MPVRNVYATSTVKCGMREGLPCPVSDVCPLPRRALLCGCGPTVVLLEFPPAAGSPPTETDIRQDLARFDSAFGLPAARLQAVNTLAHEASPWLANFEEVEDTEVVHALAPDAAIREVLIPSAPAASPGKVSAAVVGALRLGPAPGAAGEA